MHYSNSLEYIVGSSYSRDYAPIGYFSKNVGDKYGIESHIPTHFINYPPILTPINFSQYSKNQQKYFNDYTTSHTFAPEIFLNPSRTKARFIDDNNEIRSIVDETFELMMQEKMPNSISINILSLSIFMLLHSQFGKWSNGILGFSINGESKKIFVRENHLDALLLVIGHEIGHVLTDILPNKHDEEAKAFAFSIEWAKTIKKHNIAGLGINIKEDFEPARNGLHDVAFSFVEFMLKKGVKALDLHSNLIKRYISVFDKVYF